MLVEELKRRKLPDVLTFLDGSKVSSDRWSERRQELLRILAEEEYGELYEPPKALTSKSSKLKRTTALGKLY